MPSTFRVSRNIATAWENTGKIVVTTRYPDMSQRISRQSITFTGEGRVILSRAPIFGFSWAIAERPFPAPVPRVRTRAGASFRVA
ncbi:hypothetical protein [Amycolatopsis sp. WQ 127309]|uniref:hypothetical protein n=1 Tax=Amycolatopsis sp. WQ 127309 TaxID=2932773 RepID=UPI001FF1A1A7|nr:hypothetical protein [Amycolatopsis sp. WQ 127309]UOZ03526.1 hypothetical protein MUY22_32320 [Amycolatopsis sp. WQ 127309]